MNTKFLLKGLSLLAVGALTTGCSSDEIVPDTLKTVDRDSRFYINVSIASPDANSTRAGISYSNGTAEEMAIDKVLFVFYDALNNYVASAVSNGSDFTEGTTTESVEANLNIVLPVDVQEGQGVPQYVMAYVNPTAGAYTTNGEMDNDVITDKLSNVLTLGRSLEQVIPFSSTDKAKYKSGATDYLGESLRSHTGFTMTNSVYYEESDHNLPHIAAELPDGALYETEDAAKAQNATRLVIYVERVVAKVSVNWNEDEDENDSNSFADNNTAKSKDETDSYVLKFEPLAWGINNVEKGTFLIKNFRSEKENYTFGDNNSTTPSTLTNCLYSTVNSDLSELEDWNYPTHYRSFWAYSPTYFKDSNSIYPDFSDKYKGSEKSYPLRYKSLNDFYDTDNEGLGPYGGNLGNHLYTLEQTTQAAVLKDVGETAIASATIVGRYVLYKNGTKMDDVTNFYLIRGSEYNVLYDSDQIMTEAFLAQNHAIYILEDGNYRLLTSGGETSDYEICKDHFVIKHPSKDITGVYTSSRYVSLQINDDGAKSGKYYYKDINDEYVKVTTETMDEANSYLYSCIAAHFNAVEMFNNGWAYFSEPIKHLWQPSTTSTANDDAKFSASPGQYGVVRNHVYTINVTGINGIGMGISDPKDPIIIPVGMKEYYVKTEINVQSWRNVGTQNVTLTPR